MKSHSAKMNSKVNTSVKMVMLWSWKNIRTMLNNKLIIIHIFFEQSFIFSSPSIWYKKWSASRSRSYWYSLQSLRGFKRQPANNKEVLTPVLPATQDSMQKNSRRWFNCRPVNIAPSYLAAKVDGNNHMLGMNM